MAEEDKKARAGVGKILGGVFNVKNMSFKHDTIILTAANKTIAQELFLRRESIQDKFKKEVVIR